MAFNGDAYRVGATELADMGQGVTGLPRVPGLSTLPMQIKFDEPANYIGFYKLNSLITALGDEHFGVLTADETKQLISDAVFDTGTADMNKSVYDPQGMETDIFDYVDQKTGAIVSDAVSATDYNRVPAYAVAGGGAGEWTATIAGWTNTIGNMLYLNIGAGFAAGSANATLDINGLGPIPVYVSNLGAGVPLTGSIYGAGVLLLMYNGSTFTAVNVTDALAVATAAQAIATAAMPKSGGTFTDNVIANGQNRAGGFLRNFEVKNASNVQMSTNMIVGIRE